MRLPDQRGPLAATSCFLSVTSVHSQCESKIATQGSLFYSTVTWKSSIATTKRIKARPSKTDHRNPGLSLWYASKQLGSPRECMYTSACTHMSQYVGVCMCTYVKTSIVAFTYVQFSVCQLYLSAAVKNYTQARTRTHV